MSRVYLAGPMRNIPHFNFPAFHKGAAYLRARGHVVFSPAEVDNEIHGKDISKGNATGDENQAEEEHGFNLREAMARDLHFICTEAEAIALLPGWKDSKGACAEFMVARALGLKMFVLHLKCDHGYADALECPTCQHFEAVRAAE